MFDIKKSKNYLLVPEDEKAKSRKKSSKVSKELETSEEVKMQTLVFDENIRPWRCYKCKSENVEPIVSKKLPDDGEKTPRIETRKLIDVYENNVVKVALNKLRYKCNDCQATFTLDDLYPSDIMHSPEFENFIAQMIISGKETEATIVKKYGISAGKVSGALKKYITKFHNSDFKVYPCPIMYFHKFDYGKKTCCFVCGNSGPDSPLKLLEVYEEYSEEIVDKFKDKMISLDGVEIVFYDYDDSNIDMANKLSSVFSDAKIILARENLKEMLGKIKDTIDKLIDEDWKKIRKELFSLQDKREDDLIGQIDSFLDQLPDPYATTLKSKFKSVKEKIEIKKQENKNISAHELKKMLNEIGEKVSSISSDKKNENMNLIFPLRNKIDKSKEEFDFEVVSLQGRIEPIYQNFSDPFLTFCKTYESSIRKIRSHIKDEIDVSPIMEVIDGYKEKKYTSHTIVIRLMISSSAVRKAIIGTDLDRYLEGGTTFFATSTMFKGAPMRIYELQEKDVICRYVDVEDLIEEEMEAAEKEEEISGEQKFNPQYQ